MALSHRLHLLLHGALVVVATETVAMAMVMTVKVQGLKGAMCTSCSQGVA